MVRHEPRRRAFIYATKDWKFIRARTQANEALKFYILSCKKIIGVKKKKKKKPLIKPLLKPKSLFQKLIEWWKKFSPFWKFFWGIVAAIFAIIGASNAWLSINEKNQTPTEKKKNAEHQEGELLPKKIFKYYEVEPNTTVSTKPIIDNPPVIKGIRIKRISDAGLFFKHGQYFQQYSLQSLYEGVDFFNGTHNFAGVGIIAFAAAGVPLQSSPLPGFQPATY
jgi:hypothetical protein